MRRDYVGHVADCDPGNSYNISPWSFFWAHFSLMIGFTHYLLDLHFPWTSCSIRCGKLCIFWKISDTWAGLPLGVISLNPQWVFLVLKCPVARNLFPRMLKNFKFFLWKRTCLKRGAGRGDWDDSATYSGAGNRNNDKGDPHNFQPELKFSLGAVIKASVVYIFYNSSIFENWFSSWIHVKNNMDFAIGIL